MFNWNVFTTKNLGLTLLVSISFLIIGIIVKAIRIHYLKQELKQSINNINIDQEIHQ